MEAANSQSRLQTVIEKFPNQVQRRGDLGGQLGSWRLIALAERNPAGIPTPKPKAAATTKEIQLVAPKLKSKTSAMPASDVTHMTIKNVLRGPTIVRSFGKPMHIKTLQNSERFQSLKTPWKWLC